MIATVQSEYHFFEISTAELVLLAAGLALSLALLGVFIYVFTRKEDDQP